MKTSEELQPLSDMPIWARLAFMRMVPGTYCYTRKTAATQTEIRIPRRAAEATVLGFYRQGDTIWIHFTLPWDDAWSVKRNQTTARYLWPAVKSGNQ